MRGRMCQAREQASICAEACRQCEQACRQAAATIKVTTTDWPFERTIALRDTRGTSAEPEADSPDDGCQLRDHPSLASRSAALLWARRPRWTAWLCREASRISRPHRSRLHMLPQPFASHLSCEGLETGRAVSQSGGAAFPAVRGDPPPSER